jgi:hypothetical protein
MKRTIKLLGLCSIFALNLNAQDGKDFGQELTFGLKAGANFSNVYDSKGEDFRADGKLGLIGGAFFAIPLGKMIGVQPEFLFSQKGFKAEGTILGSPYKFTRTTNFIDVPLLFVIKPVKFVSILAGPQFSYLLKQKDVFQNAYSTIEQEQEFENEEIRKNTLGVVAGLDININQLVIGTRINWDMTQNSGDGTSTTPRYKNVWFQGTIAYRF